MELSLQTPWPWALSWWWRWVPHHSKGHRLWFPDLHDYPHQPAGLYASCGAHAQCISDGPNRTLVPQFQLHHIAVPNHTCTNVCLCNNNIFLSFFHNTVSFTAYVASSRRMWKEAVMACLNHHLSIFLEGLRKTTNILCQIRRFLGRESNLWSLKYEASVLIIQPRHYWIQHILLFSFLDVFGHSFKQFYFL